MAIEIIDGGKYWRIVKDGKWYIPMYWHDGEGDWMNYGPQYTSLQAARNFMGGSWLGVLERG
jgi:hypothetical protein